MEGREVVDDRFEILEVWRRPLSVDPRPRCACWPRSRPGPTGRGVRGRHQHPPRRPALAAAGRGRPLHRAVVRRGALGGRRARQRSRPGGGRREPALRPPGAGRSRLARGRARVRGGRARRPPLGAARAVGAGRGPRTAVTPSRSTRSTAATRPSSCCARPGCRPRSGSRTAQSRPPRGPRRPQPDAPALRRRELDEAHGIIEAAQANLAHHPDDGDEDEEEERD